MPNLILSAPSDVELRIVLSYVAAVLVGARIVEALARAHFSRALRYDQDGFGFHCENSSGGQRGVGFV